MNVILFLCYTWILLIEISGAKVRKLIDFFKKDAPKDLEKVPNYNEESVAFKRNKKFNPCLENPNLCSNGGKCHQEDGNFYCVCPLTHYGKICEHVADPTNCDRHLCQNNSTCVSTKEKRTLVNTVALHRLRAAKGGNQELTDTELAQLDVEVQYECICQRGTFGAFCDESEADRSCQEVYCLGRGKGKSGRNGTCSCQCEKQFFGERCEQLSACFDTRCENGGICEDVVDWKLKTVTASCKCPNSVEIVKAKVSGETCEKLEIPTTTDKQFIPCETSSNSSQFYKKLLTTIDLDFMNDISELEAIRDDYHDGMSTSAQMNEGWCRNDGKCVPQVIRVRSNRSYYIPSCQCTDPLSDGIYCEYKRKDGCSLTRDEVARGARADEKCTDMQHGACVDIMGKATCVCKPDYTGETCEMFDPCARHPCKHGDCIPIPSSADSALGTNRYQCLCPLSARLDPNNDCVAIDRVACPRDACANGRCVPCDDDDNDVSKTASSKSLEKDDDLMPLCNSNEQRQGYRCLCEAGYLPPTCTVPTNQCHQNLCQNGAACNVTEHKSYDCICLNGTRGSLCETVDDACDAFGHSVCQNGVCENDEYSHRAFSCQCHDSFEGLNCDVPLPKTTVLYRRAMKYYHLTLPLSACFLSLLILFLIAVTSKRKRGGGGKIDKKEKEDVEKKESIKNP